MSDSLELNPVPAFELSKALYLEEESKHIYDNMTQAEKEKTNYLMSLLQARLKAANNSYLSYMTRSLLHKPLVVENFSATENIQIYLEYLGYESEQVPVLISSSKTIPVLVIRR